MFLRRLEYLGLYVGLCNITLKFELNPELSADQVGGILGL